jgi:MSHA pilin protein MshC
MTLRERADILRQAHASGFDRHTIMNGARPGGFTLVEMIVTLIIVALIAAVAGPMFFSLGAFRESGFYDETVSAVRYAQKHAVATGCSVRVLITSTGYALVWPASVPQCNSTASDIPIADPSGNATGFTRTAPGGVTLSAADFTFSASGTASVTPSIVITVGSRQLTVIGETGFVQAQ